MTIFTHENAEHPVTEAGCSAAPGANGLPVLLLALGGLLLRRR